MNSTSAGTRLIVFCGKGGVGKTTLSLAFGLWNAARGSRTVVVTSHPLAELAVTISLQGLKEQLPVAASNLFVVHIDPREEIAGRVRQQIPSPFLARAVISSRIYQSLVEVAPGLKEIAFLARLRSLAERKTDEGGAGHFVQTLKVSRNFDSYLSGPFAVVGREMSRFFIAPGNVKFIPVTTLEEMAVEETIDLCRQIAAESGSHPASVICNLASPLLCASDAQYAELREHVLEGNQSCRELKFVLDRHAVERELFRRLSAAIGIPPQIVERRAGTASDLDLLRNLSGTMGQNLGDLLR
jgi:anion-transporting  ArsA/GET3 family ATPase